MVVPAWDFDEDRWLHSRMAMLRAVENGFTLVRSSRNGNETVSDEKGRIINEKESSKKGVEVTTSKINIRKRKTLYGKNGDLISYIISTAAIILIVASLFRKKK